MGPGKRSGKTIWFFNEGSTYVLKKKGEIRTWMNRVIRQEGFRPGEVNVIFCNDEYLLEINIKYLNHNTLTDIITFDLSEIKGTLQGDIYISIERAKENAGKFGVSLRDEIRRLLVHGILHLAGLEDTSPEEKEQMTALEDYYLSLASR